MYKKILIPVDGSATSKKALAAALQMARENGGRVRLVHSMDDLAYVTGYEYTADVLKIAQDYAGKVLDEAMASAKAAGVEAERQLVEAPGQRLGEAVRAQAGDFGADLIVIGTHGRRGISRVLLGSGAEQIIRLAPVPVLVVRGDEQPA